MLVEQQCTINQQQSPNHNVQWMLHLSFPGLIQLQTVQYNIVIILLGVKIILSFIVVLYVYTCEIQMKLSFLYWQNPPIMDRLKHALLSLAR